MSAVDIARSLPSASLLRTVLNCCTGGGANAPHRTDPGSTASHPPPSSPLVCAFLIPSEVLPTVAPQIMFRTIRILLIPALHVLLGLFNINVNYPAAQLIAEAYLLKTTVHYPSQVLATDETVLPGTIPEPGLIGFATFPPRELAKSLARYCYRWNLDVFQGGVSG